MLGVYITLPDEVKDSRTLRKRRLHPGNKFNFQWSSLSMTSIEQNEGIIARLCANSLINSNVIELRNFAVLQILTGKDLRFPIYVYKTFP